MAGNGNGSNGNTPVRRISLVEARLPVGTAEIMGDDGTVRDVLVYPPSTGSEEALLVLTENAQNGHIDARANLDLSHRIAQECAPDASQSEIRRLTEDQAGLLIAFARTRGQEVATYIAERRARLNPPVAAATTRRKRKG